MNKRFGYLEKKQSSLAILMSPNGIYVVITSKRYRRKMLRGTKLFFGKVTMASKEYSNAAILDTIREWWEETQDEQLFARLFNAPLGQKPTIMFDRKMIIDFNKNEDYLTKALFDTDSEIYKDVND